MSSHTITYSVPSAHLGNADAEFIADVNGRSIGRLKISRGRVVWVPANAKYGFQLDWTSFGKMMAAHGKKQR